MSSIMRRVAPLARGAAPRAATAVAVAAAARTAAPAAQFPGGSALSQRPRVRPLLPHARAASSYEKNVTKMEGEEAPVNLYDGHYSDHTKAAQTKVRTYTYGEDGWCRSPSPVGLSLP